MCTVLLPPGDNPIAVNKYIISYINLGTSFTNVPPLDSIIREKLCEKSKAVFQQEECNLLTY